MPSKNTKERLIETAIDLIWVSSYGSVSVDDICKTAGVKKGSFYHYFPSKIDLAIAAMDASFAHYKPHLDEVFSPALPPLERLSAYAKRNYEIQCEVQEQHGMVCGCPMASLASEMAPQDSSIQHKTDEIIAQKMKYYEAVVRDLIAENHAPRDTDVSATAKNIFSYIMGQNVMARIQNSLEPLVPATLEGDLLRIIGVGKKD